MLQTENGMGASDGSETEVYIGTKSMSYSMNFTG